MPLFLLLLVCAASRLFAADLEPITLKLKWQHQFQFAGYYAAIEKGFYADAGFDVTLMPHDGSEDLFDGVLAGRYQFGIADSSVVIRRLQGEPVVIVSTVFQQSPLVLISLRDSGIRSPYELIGKNIMFQQGADDAAIQAMLTTLGIHSEQYQALTHNFDNFALLQENPTVHAMSAYLSDQPFRYQEMGMEVHILDPSSYGIDFYGDLIYTSESYLKKHPEKVAAFKDASLRGWRYALAHPDEVIQWLQNRWGNKSSLASLQYEAEITEQMIALGFVELGTLYRQRFNRIANIYQQLDLTPKDASLQGLFLADHVQEDAENRRRFIRMVALMSSIFMAITLLLLIGLYSLRATVKKRTAELHASNEALSEQIQLTDRYIISAILSLDEHFLDVSTAMCLATGYSRKELLAMKPTAITPPKIHEDRAKVLEHVAQGHSWRGEMPQLTKTGKTLWVDMFLDPLKNTQGQIDRFRATAVDITEKKLIEKISETDTLTGIANRKKLDDTLYTEWARFLRYKTAFSVILFDLDHFKQVNDQYGHLEGDKVLIASARNALKHLRAADTLGRWGGEEFLIILPETHLKQAELVAEKLRKAIHQISDLSEPTISASFGVACSNQTIDNVESLIRHVDEALYKAKAQGRNRVELYDQKHDKHNPHQ